MSFKSLSSFCRLVLMKSKDTKDKWHEKDLKDNEDHCAKNKPASINSRLMAILGFLFAGIGQ